MPRKSVADITYQQIVDYWARRESEERLGVDWAEAASHCWRCGYESRLQKCHIVPHSLGGREELSNLVLLCARCHREAPNVSDPRFMWIWLRTTCVGFYGLYWDFRGSQEFKRMFGRWPFTGAEFQRVPQERLRALVAAEVKKATIHFGEGRLNPSTIASIFAMIEERVTGHAPTPDPDSSVGREFLEMIGWVKPRHGAAA